jgi:acyl-coenzyme A synthetase/AMP-(fatty) acid ligase
MPQANIEYVGRVDEQVKIRGFRIELGEIEQKLLSISNSKEGCVIVKNDAVLGKMHVAYVPVVNKPPLVWYMWYVLLQLVGSKSE